LKGRAGLLRNLFRNLAEPDLTLHQRLPEPSPELSPDLLRNLLRNPVERELALHQNLLDLSGTSLNLTRRLHQCTPELFWPEDLISLRYWGEKEITGKKRKTYLLSNIKTVFFSEIVKIRKNLFDGKMK